MKLQDKLLREEPKKEIIWVKKVLEKT